MTGVVAGQGRGVTRIADRVVERIATRAAGETEDIGRLDRTVLGVPVGGHRPARTDVSVEGDLVTARVQLAVAYPTPVRDAAGRVRDRVRDQVETLTGLTVRQVDIDVTALERPVSEQSSARVEVL